MSDERISAAERQFNKENTRDAWVFLTSVRRRYQQSCYSQAALEAASRGKIVGWEETEDGFIATVKGATYPQINEYIVSYAAHVVYEDDYDYTQQPRWSEWSGQIYVVWDDLTDGPEVRIKIMEYRPFGSFDWREAASEKQADIYIYEDTYATNDNEIIAAFNNYLGWTD